MSAANATAAVNHQRRGESAMKPYTISAATEAITRPITSDFT